MSMQCSHSGCHNNVLMALPQCQYCKRRFCTSHMLPQVHGCGLACKNASVRQATDEAIAQRKARKHVGNEDALARLHKKLAENEAARRKKAPKGKQK